jgi:uncharacterized repeat protein (TIGR03803 family)
LIEGSDGALYGTSESGGSSGSAGSVYKLNKDGSGFRVLQTLSTSPKAGLIEGKDGAIYGVAQGGDLGFGMIFKISFSIPCPTLVIDPDLLPPALVGAAYSQLLTASAGASLTLLRSIAARCQTDSRSAVRG